VWTVLVFVIYTVAGVAGREHFSEILSNFLAILGYWIAFFIAVLLEEHYLFRRAACPWGLRACSRAASASLARSSAWPRSGTSARSRSTSGPTAETWCARPTRLRAPR
jgi:purine-cytosine permease-like protein